MFKLGNPCLPCCESCPAGRFITVTGSVQCGTIDGGTAHLYRDGTLIATGSTSGGFHEAVFNVADLPTGTVLTWDLVLSPYTTATGTVTVPACGGSVTVSGILWNMDSLPSTLTLTDPEGNVISLISYNSGVGRFWSGRHTYAQPGTSPVRYYEITYIWGFVPVTDCGGYTSGDPPAHTCDFWIGWNSNGATGCTSIGTTLPEILVGTAMSSCGPGGGYSSRVPLLWGGYFTSAFGCYAANVAPFVLSLVSPGAFSINS